MRPASPPFLFLILALLTFSGATALAGPRDKPALKKYDEAIFTHFLNMEFDKAEALLLGTIQACGDKCSSEVVARGWMYVGVVRGSGKENIEGAKEAFLQAVSIDPNVVLDEEVATDPVKDAFQAIGGEAIGAAGGGGDIDCSLDATEVQTRRPVPVTCTGPEGGKVKLYYKPFARSWQSVSMRQRDGEWQGTIPCDATDISGTLRWYVEAGDASSGSEDDPHELSIVDETDEEPPSFDGAAAPARCPEGGGAVAAGGGGPSATDEPCAGWGQECGAFGCCDGLACVAGTCEAAESCDTDDDCSDGVCKSGTCAREKKKAEHPQNLVGLHFGMDLAMVSAGGACSRGPAGDNFSCWNTDGTQYLGTPNVRHEGRIGSGFVPATMRVMASYERLFTENIGVEARLGFAFGGGPTPEGGSSFLPAHAEVRAKYWFGSNPMASEGLRPYAFLGGGVAQVDATVRTQLADCGENPAESCIEEPDAPGATVIDVDATRVAGLSFVTVGGGLMYAVAESHGVVLNLNLMMMMPASAVVVQPSLGYALGF